MLLDNILILEVYDRVNITIFKEWEVSILSSEVGVSFFSIFLLSLKLTVLF